MNPVPEMPPMKPPADAPVESPIEVPDIPEIPEIPEIPPSEPSPISEPGSPPPVKDPPPSDEAVWRGTPSTQKRQAHRLPRVRGIVSSSGSAGRDLHNAM